MKVWILTSETPFFNPGGIARYVDNFSRFLGEAGHDVVVISRGEEDGLRELAPGYRLLSFRPACDRPLGGWTEGPADRHPHFPYNIMDFWTALSFQMSEVVAELVKTEGRPDVIEAQEYGAIPYYVLQRQLTEPGYLEGVPLVVNAHSPDFLMRGLNEEPRFQLPAYWVGQLEKACFHAAHSVICPSRYLADQLESLLDDPELKVSNFPLPWTPVDKIDASGPGRDRELVYFGRLEVRKGVLRMLECCEREWSEGVSFRLALLGGDTHYVPRNCTVAEFIRNRYGHRIEQGLLELVGNLPQEEALRRIVRSAGVLIPSIWENWPNTCIEAMALRRVVLASEHGGQTEMLGDDGQAGLLFSWERDDFSDQLRNLLALGADQRQEMGRVARERIATLCAPEVVMPKRLAHFERVIEGHREGRSRVFPFSNRHLRESQVAAQIPEIPSDPGLVSAVVPFFKLGAYLEECVDSILASEYEHLEVVIVDDGNRETTDVQALERIRERGDERVRIVSIPNGGLANARNTGAEAARGKFLAFVDADDCLAPSFIPRALEVLSRYDNVFIVFSWEAYFEASQDVYPGWNFEFPYLLAHNMTSPLCLVQKDAFLAFGRNKRKFKYNFEDYESWISMVKQGCGGVCLHEPLVRYRIRRDSMWQGSSRRQHLYLYDLILEEHPDLYQQYGPELFGLQNANGSAQEFIKPSMYSPYDRYREWSDGEIAALRQRAHDLWREKDKLAQQAEISWKLKLQVKEELKRLYEKL